MRPSAIQVFSICPSGESFGKDPVIKRSGELVAVGLGEILEVAHRPGAVRLHVGERLVDHCQCGAQLLRPVDQHLLRRDVHVGHGGRHGRPDSMRERARPASISRMVSSAENTIASTWCDRKDGMSAPAPTESAPWRCPACSAIQSAAMSEVEALVLMPIFLPARSFTLRAGRIRGNDQVPAGVAGEDRRHHLLLHAFADRERDGRAEIRDDIGRSRGERLLRRRSAAKCDQPHIEPGLLEGSELLGGKGRRIIGAAAVGKADPDLGRLRAGERQPGHEQRRERQRAGCMQDGCFTHGTPREHIVRRFGVHLARANLFTIG